MTTSRLAGDVMAAVDFSDQTDRIVNEGMGLARASEGTLHLVHIAAGEPILAGYDKEDISPFTRQVRAGELTDEHRRLRELAEGLRAATGVDIHVVVLLGPTAQTLLEASRELDATHIVLGTHGHGGLHHLLVGSVAEEVVRRSHIPVVLVPIPKS